MKNLMFLGAGASKSDGAPLQGELFREYFKMREFKKQEIGIEGLYESELQDVPTDVKIEGKVRKLPINILDTQNYIAASEMVIAKAGWGTIAESIIAGSKLVLIERTEVYEDTYMINFLKNENLAISIEEDELKSLDIKTLFKRANQSIDTDKINKFKNDTGAILNLLSL